MKTYPIKIIIVVAVLAVCVVTWTAFGQREGKPTEVSEQQRQRPRSREEVEQQNRERFDFARHFLSPEEQAKAIDTIRTELAKYERDKEILHEELKEKSKKLQDQDWRKRLNVLHVSMANSIKSIEDQCAKAEGAWELRKEHMKGIDELKGILELAKKEKAEETAESIEKLIEKKDTQYKETLKKLGFD